MKPWTDSVSIADTTREHDHVEIPETSGLACWHFRSTIPSSEYALLLELAVLQSNPPVNHTHWKLPL
jgi:hypothetical protein